MITAMQATINPRATPRAMIKAIEKINAHLTERKLLSLTGEALRCVVDPDRHTEACWIVDALRSRVHVPATLTNALRDAMVARFGRHKYLAEFPDYGALDFPLPPGFDDVSWHNDCCPSFAGDNYVMFAAYKHVEHREHCGERFGLVVGNPDSQYINEHILSADSVEREIMPFVAATRRYNTAQRLWIGQRVTRAKAEIVHAVVDKVPFSPLSRIVPLTVDDIDDMRYYCDVNILGGVADPLVGDEGRTVFGGYANLDAWHAAIRLVQTTIHNWLACGSMRAVAERTALQGAEG